MYLFFEKLRSTEFQLLSELKNTPEKLEISSLFQNHLGLELKKNSAVVCMKTSYI